MTEELVLSTRCRLVPRFVMVTVAPDTAAFVESDTAPVISAVGVCAETAKESANRAKTLFTMFILQALGRHPGAVAIRNTLYWNRLNSGATAFQTLRRHPFNRPSGLCENGFEKWVFPLIVST